MTWRILLLAVFEGLVPFPIFLFHIWWFYFCSVQYVACALFIITKLDNSVIMLIKKKKSTNDLLTVLNVHKGKVKYEWQNAECTMIYKNLHKHIVTKGWHEELHDDSQYWKSPTALSLPFIFLYILLTYSNPAILV